MLPAAPRGTGRADANRPSSGQIASYRGLGPQTTLRDCALPLMQNDFWRLL